METALDLAGLPERTQESIMRSLASGEHEEWATAAAKVGHCLNPVRLHGWANKVDTRTGEIVSAYSSRSEPLGVLHVRCGNRRADECPSCSRIYAADTFHLIRCGVVGGKGVPEDVSANPLVFATLTAPSFGAVHRAGEQGCRRNAPRTLCPHGRPQVCLARHGAEDAECGQPICPACYDYDGHVVWQWWAPELWRRFIIALRRALARTLGVPSTRLADTATLQYAKVAEFQRRGAIHFHALFRLDGPKSDAGYEPAPPEITAATLAGIIRQVSREVSVAVPTPAGDTQTLHFGRQVDARAVREGPRHDLAGGDLSGEQVAGYLAKYATKSASASIGEGWHDAHVRRLRRTVARLAAQVEDEPDSQYELLSRWIAMLGFRGHFSTKSRRYSVTLGQLRRARRRWQALTSEAHRTGAPIDPDELEELLMQEDDTSTVLVISNWSYAGTGWRNDGEVALARAAAAYAQEHARQAAQTETNTEMKES